MARADVAVIGGGAAGFFGAIAAAEANPGLRVIILEAGREPLAKVRISGGGRCNVTHACFDPAELIKAYPRGAKALRGAFSRFQPGDAVDWFGRHGVELKIEDDGRMFPTTDDSATIVDCLQLSAERLGIQVWTGTPVRGVTATPDGFRLALGNGSDLEARHLLLASGSSPGGYRLAEQLGHELVPPVPSLFTFKVADPALRELAGVSLPEVRLQLHSGGQKFQQTGPLLITHWGLSGPAVLKLSAWAARELQGDRYQAQLTVNWLPGWDGERLGQSLRASREQQPRRQLSSWRPVPLPQRLWLYLLERQGIDPQRRWTETANRDLERLREGLHSDRYAISGKGEFKEEFVTAGGIRLQDVDFRRMESRLQPGLHFAGEVLDIDGITGGFNFQNAWTTGWLAGQAIAAT